MKLPTSFKDCEWEYDSTPTVKHFACIYKAFYERIYFERAETLPLDFLFHFERDVISRSFILTFNTIIDDLVGSLALRQYTYPYHDLNFSEKVLTDINFNSFDIFLGEQVSTHQIFSPINIVGQIPKKDIMKWLISLKEFICKFTFLTWKENDDNVDQRDFLEGFSYDFREEDHIYYAETVGDMDYPYLNLGQKYEHYKDIVNKPFEKYENLSSNTPLFYIDFSASQIAYGDFRFDEDIRMTQINKKTELHSCFDCYIPNRGAFDFQIAYYLKDVEPEEYVIPLDEHPFTHEANIYRDEYKVIKKRYDVGVKHMEYGKINVYPKSIPAYSFTKVDFLNGEKIQYPPNLDLDKGFDVTMTLRPLLFWKDFNCEGGFDFR